LTELIVALIWVSVSKKKESTIILLFHWCLREGLKWKSRSTLSIAIGSVRGIVAESLTLVVMPKFYTLKF